MKASRYALVLALAALGPQAQAASVKIGILVTTTGPYSPWGKDYQEGIGLYLDEHNGKDGNPTVEVLYRDVGGDNPPRARQLAQELIVRDQVAVLGGLEFTTTVLAVADVINEAKIPFVIFNSASDFVTDKSLFFIRPTFTEWPTASTAGQWAAEHEMKRATIVAADYSPGKDAIDDFTAGFTAKGGTVADVIRVPMGTTDFSSYFARVKDVAPQVLYVFMPGGPMSIEMAKGYAERGFAKTGMHYLGAATPERDLPAIGDAAIGFLAVSNYVPHLDNPMNQKFVAAFTAKYKGELPTFATVAAYDGMELIFHMLKSANGPLDGEKAVASVKGYAWESPRGPASIDPKTREVTENLYVTEVKKVEGALFYEPFLTYANVRDTWHDLNPPK